MHGESIGILVFGTDLCRRASKDSHVVVFAFVPLVFEENSG